MNILEWITDLVATAWELLGLIWLSSSVDPVLLRSWEAGLKNEAEDSGGGIHSDRSTNIRQPGFA
jgi:hypothetical protein